MNYLSVAAYCFLYALLNVTGSTTIKHNLNGKKLASFSDYLNVLLNPYIIAGFAVIFLSVLAMFKALSLGKFTYVVPLSAGINFILTVIAGVLFFNDKLSFYSYLGLILILAGIALISIKPGT